ncbi:MAG: SAM-dependent methyltransferase [Limisphaerales bacterium]
MTRSTNRASKPPLKSITLTPIGMVESSCGKVSDRMDYAAESRVIVLPELLPAPTGIEHFSHLWVIYYQHLSGEWREAHGWRKERVLVHPPTDDRSGQGIFASRAPVRPAALGSCIVEFVQREGTVLTVRGLDAIRGTPVLDVKVYVPQFDAFPGAITPLHWARVISHANDLSSAARCFHWETTQVEFALGFRAGLVSLEKLAVRPGQGLSGQLSSSLFFAQGYEAATGCSPLRGTLDWTERSQVQPPWDVRLAQGANFVEFKLAQLDWADASSVMNAKEPEILSAFSKSPNCKGWRTEEPPA